MSLSTSTPSTTSTQTSTQDPQTPVQPGSLQPTNSGSDLTSSSSGVVMQPATVQTVALSSATVSTQPSAPAPHHSGTGLAAVAILLFIVAVVLFASTTMSAKNTTK